MKKILSIILAILMVVTMIPMAVLPASAASTPTPYDGVPVTPQKISSSNYAKLGLTSSNWSQFNGYYAIRNAKELYGFASVVSKTANTQGTNAVLLQDIVVNANGGTTYDWSPIADQTDSHDYEGIFDGNGHYISGLYSTKALMPTPGNNKKCGGFICNLCGTVKNLVIKNSTFAPGMDLSVHGGLGAITGYPFDCTIQNCRVENITLKSINDGGQLGGIAGFGNGNSSTIKNCVSINVTFSGGIITDPIAPNAPYSSCYTSATASHNCTKLSVEHKEVKATCEYPGLSNYKYCLVCGKVTSGTKTETPATGHTLKSATCIAPKTCTICGATEGSVDNTAHSWANNDGICANGCGATCAHKNQTGSVCEICGAELHVCRNYDNGFCTECDAYEPAELKDGYYQIKNGGNLFWYANYINTVDRTANAVLTADIDLENRPWTPIGATGENSNNFRGIFDGQNHTITGLNVEGGRAGLGFFGEVRTGTVKNFTIYGEVVVNTEVDYVGGVIGSICGVNGENDLERNGATIQNIRSFVNLTAKAHGVGMIGGFVGYANHESLIENCSWYGTFDAGKYRVDSGAGGFIGKIRENSSEVTIRNCGAYGTIKTNYAKNSYNNTPTIYMGGFLSFSNTNAQTTLENCLFAGKFERGENLTDEAFLGAFGTLRSVNAIRNCYYLGDDGLEAVHSDSNLKPGSDNVEITKATEEQLKYGEIAYKLQEANEIWGQSIGTDAYPVLGGEDVYCGYTACDDEAMVYTNDSTVSDTKPDHAWGEGSLTRPTKTQDGYYTYTCSACGETKTEPVLRAANYDDYTKALEDLRAYLDSDMLTDENKSNISEWLATYDTDEAFSFIAGEEATVQEYIDATAYYASEFEAAIQDCLAGNHSGNGETCSVCGATIKFATVTDGTNTYYAADAATLNQAVTAILETGSRTFTVELPADTEAEMITAIRRAICDTEGVADGSINLTLKGVTSIPGTTNWDGVAFGPGDIYDEAGEIVDQELVTQLASVNLPDATEIGAQAFYFCENLVSVSAPKAQTIGAQAFGYTALTSVEFPELTTIPTDMFSGTWTLSSAKFPKVTTIEQNGLLIGAKFAPENNPTPFPLELTAEGDITFNGSYHFNVESQNYSGKVDLVLNIDKKDQVTFHDDGTATWQVRDDLSYTFKSITFACTDGTTNHSYTYTDNGDGTHDKVCTGCGYVEVDNEAHTGGTATCTEQAECQHCGASYGEVNAHDWSNLDGVCANGCGEVCPHEKYTNGVCDKCGYACPHDSYTNGFCTECDAYEPAVDSDSDGYYEIGNAGQLYWFADKAKNDRTNYGSANAILTQNIVVNENVLTADGKLNGSGSDFRAWIPPYSYKGTFDGAGKTVSGLYFKDTEERDVGFIGYLNGGTVKNLTVKDSYFNAYSAVGGIVGSVFKGTVTDCFSSATVIAGSLGYAGGIAGENGAGLVERCANSGFVTSGYEAGGIVGYNHNYYDDPDPAIIRHCYNIGSVSGHTVGGIVGFAVQQVGSSVEIDSCWAACELNGTNNVGGLIGHASGSTIRCCRYDKTVFTGNPVGKKTSCNILDSGFKSTEEFASGAAAYLLNGKSSGGFWRQTIGTDAYPGFSGDKVYYGYISCADNAKKVYTNDATATEVKPAHNWSNNDGICANGCGYVCTHVSYTDGVCDNCGYECPHEWGEGVLTRPTFETDGYYTYTCTLCGHSYTEPTEKADTTALNDAYLKVTEYIDNDTLTQEAKDEIYKSYRDILKNNGNIFDELGFVRGDLIEEDQPAINAVTAELEKIIADADEKIASGEYVKADYTSIDNDIDELEYKLENKMITDEGKSGFEEIKKQLNEMKADENTSKADLAELKKALREYEAEIDKGIEDGTLVKFDGEKVFSDYEREVGEALIEKYGADFFHNFINEVLGEKFNTEHDKIYSDACTLTGGTMAENAENIAQIKASVDEFYGKVVNCIEGVHNGFVYEVTEEAKCGVNAIESATCTLCGETDEREVEGTALEHLFLDYTSNGDATCTADGTKTASCALGCGATDTVADEGSMIDHTDEDGDNLCDDCQAEIVDTCPDCGRKAHDDSFVQNLICLIIQLIKLINAFIVTVK